LILERTFIHKDIVSEKSCDELINYFNSNKDKQYVPKHKIKIDTEICLEAKATLDLNYFKELSNIVNNYKNKFTYSNQSHNPWSIWEGPIIQKYSPGEGFLKYHFENQYPKYHSRHLVFMTFLNNIDEGGETEFLYQKVKFKPKKGLTLIWPTDWTHTHRGCPCKKTKYIITGWYGFENIS
jgi:hypothetical protein|tara:strand:- start:389 stop:931 length:543 start_codon:yes stop_codon:yes gene_type:complete